MDTPIRKLSCPAPHKEWVELPVTGKAYSRPWTLPAVISALSGGGWFSSGHHSFDSTETAVVVMETGAKRGKRVVARPAPLPFATLDAALDALYAEVTRV